MPIGADVGLFGFQVFAEDMIARVGYAAVFEVGAQRSAVLLTQCLHFQHVENRRRHVNVLGEGVDDGRFDTAWPAHHEWDAQRRVIPDVFLEAAMLAEAVTVVGGIYEERIAVEA